MHTYTHPSFDGNISTPEQAWQDSQKLYQLHMEREAKMQEAKQRLWRENIKDDLQFAMFRNPKHPISDFTRLQIKDKNLCEQIIIKLALHDEPDNGSSDVILDTKMVLGRFVDYIDGKIQCDDTYELTEDLQTIFYQNILSEFPDYFIDQAQALMDEVLQDKHEMLAHDAELNRGVA